MAGNTTLPTKWQVGSRSTKHTTKTFICDNDTIVLIIDVVVLGQCGEHVQTCRWDWLQQQPTTKRRRLAGETSNSGDAFHLEKDQLVSR